MKITNRVVLSTPISRTTIFAVVALLAPFGVLSSVLLTNISPAQAAINEELHFQARLLSAAGSLSADGNYNIQFHIYSDGDGDPGTADETLEWSSSYLKGNTQGIDVANGYVAAQLGESASSQVGTLGGVDWGNGTLWLSINIGDTSSTSTVCTTEANFNSNCGGDGEMGPFIRLGSTPYAFNAANLEGRGADQFVQLDPGGTSQAVNTANTLIDIDQAGAGDLINLEVGSTQVLGVNNAGTLNLAGGALQTNGTTRLTNGGALQSITGYTQISGNFSISGTGTFGTGTGAISLNGNTSITGANTLTVGGVATFNGNLVVSAGSQLTNRSSTLFTSIGLGPFAVDGSIGLATATVDIATTFDITASTTGVDLTLPAPTSSLSGRIIYINNTGANSFTVEGNPIAAGSSSSYIWNGSAWVQTISFTSTGVDAVGALDGGTANANGATITGTDIFLQSASVNFPGLVNTTTQSFAGAKTFTGATTVQTTVDSTSGFRVLDSDGGTPIFNVDTTNERVGIGTATPGSALQVVGTIEDASYASLVQVTATATSTTNPQTGLESYLIVSPSAASTQSYTGGSLYVEATN